MRMDQSFPNWGGVKPVEYQAIDLGLPSGLKWCNMNVGAISPEDGGLYFQWGDTVGYTVDQVGVDKQFSSNWSDYKFGTQSNFTKYNKTDGKMVLDPEDDMAHVNMGGSWRMPTKDDIQELLDNTTKEWVTNYNGIGISGKVFTSKINGNSIFIPAAGCAIDGSVGDVGNEGILWPSLLDGYNVILVRCMFFNSAYEGLNVSYCRYYGFPVRAVLAQ